MSWDYIFTDICMFLLQPSNDENSTQSQPEPNIGECQVNNNASETRTGPLKSDDVKISNTRIQKNTRSVLKINEVRAG